MARSSRGKQSTRPSTNRRSHSLDTGAQKGDPIPLQLAPANFDEDAYLKRHPGLAQAIRDGQFANALEHYLLFGEPEDGVPTNPTEIAAPIAQLAQIGRSRVDRRAVVDFVRVSPDGIAFVGGWVDDSEDKLVAILVRFRGRQVALQATQIGRYFRPDVHEHLQSSAHREFAIWSVFSLTVPARQDEAIEVELCLESGWSTVARLTTTLLPAADFRETVLGFFASFQCLGNPNANRIKALENFLGGVLKQLNSSILATLSQHVVVERFGVNRLASRRKTAMVTCLLGKPEYLFLQGALFSVSKLSDTVEMIYVCNSPELAEAICRDAYIVCKIYGLSLTVVLMGGNVGFGPANNVGAKVSGADRLLLVNPDVFPRDGEWLVTHNRLVEVHGERAKLLGCKLYYDDGSVMHAGMYVEMGKIISYDEAGGSKNHDLSRVEHYGKGAPGWAKSVNTTRFVPAITGAFMSIDRKWFEVLGGFSDEYVFGHYEDADLCLKSYVRGVPSLYCPELELWHLEGKGSVRRAAYEGASIYNRWWFTRTWADLVKKELDGPNVRILPPTTTAPASDTSRVKPLDPGPGAATQAQTATSGPRRVSP